jgi:hypothetical protein
MRFSLLATLALITAACSDAFIPTAFAKKSSGPFTITPRKMAFAIDVPTEAIPGMKPGTSGLRKKVEIWQAVDPSNKNYVENFIQSLLDTAKENNGGEMLHT